MKAFSGVPHILVVEDDEVDIKLIRKYVKLINARVKLSVVNNGLEAIRFLRKREPYAQEPDVDLMILDINMPRMNGKELLSIVSSDADLKTIVKLVLSSSENESDVAKCYGLGANAYICKSDDPQSFRETLSSILEFWFCTARLPRMSPQS